MYRREALIDERRKDIEWIDKLIEDSKTVAIKPEINREIETITAISAALGLKFDPTAALSYRRANETGEIKQEIDTLKLQLQLDQLKRDAALAREKFEAQTDPVNADLGKLSSDAGAAAPAGISATDQLKAAIERLATATYDFNKEVKATAVAATAISPLDDFRDRQAYRDTLKAARNAASLDELHDLRGSALLRLNFQATAIPDAKKSRIAGVVQMRVIPPEPGSALRNRFYRGWLDYVNRRVNLSDGNGGFTTDAALLQGGVTDNFEQVYFIYPPTPGVAATAHCHGIVSASDLSKFTTCGTLSFVAPQQSSRAPGAKAFMTFTADTALMLANSDAAETASELQRRMWVTSNSTQLFAGCRYVDLPFMQDQQGNPAPAYRLQQALRNARSRMIAGDHYIALDRIARDRLKVSKIDPGIDPNLARIRERTAQAGILVETFRGAAVRYLATVPGGCPANALSEMDRDDPEIYLTPWAQQVLWGDDARVAIYEIGPREQTQQMSTVARSANSLSLALSVAASAPSSGVAADAAAGYSRQAMGRAEALERIPTVVGYSVGGLKTFGWVLGPKATVDPKGSIKLEQGLRAYDLTVDLSVPGWWPDFQLETLTAWAPRRSELSNGKVQTQVLRDEKGNTHSSIIASRKVRVPMLSNDADYSGFTQLLASGGFDPRREAGFKFDGGLGLQKVSACRASTIVLKGPLLWRATTVIVGGVKINGSSLSILPDMSGIMVDVPALDDKIVGTGTTTHVNVLTPYGNPDGIEIAYEAAPTDGCKKADKTDAKPDANAPEIAGYDPKTFQLPGVVKIHVSGKQIDKISKVTFGVVDGVISGQSATDLDVKFPQDETSTMPPSQAVSVSFYFNDHKGKEQKVEKTVAILSNKGAD